MNPTPLTFLVFALLLVPIALALTALVSLLRHRAMLSSTAVAVWALTVLLFPVLGAIVWFALGRPRGAGSPLRED